MTCSEFEGNRHRFAVWTGLLDENLGVFEVGALDFTRKDYGKIKRH
jgi:hypothetical protein